jgi:HEAT repeat protein
MRRGLVALAIAVASVIATSPASADDIDDQIEELDGASGYKVRLAAALSLSKVQDDRAVFALARALLDDPDKNVRRVCALALKKAVTAKTGLKARKEALAALKDAKKDRDKKVKKEAGKTLASLEALFAVKAPRVFVKIDPSKDKTKKAPAKAVTELDRAMRTEVVRASKDFAVDWPGELPTGGELEQQGTLAFLINASVTKVAITTQGSKATVQCSIEIRVTPWGGTDGEERWVANQTGKATGSAKATTGSSTRETEAGVIDCVSAVAEQLTDDQIVPFIRRLTKDS